MDLAGTLYVVALGLLVFTVPKLLFLPIIRAMWQAMKASEQQDALDDAWLAAREGSGGDGGTPAAVPWNRRRPGPRRPGGPERSPGTAARRPDPDRTAP